MHTMAQSSVRISNSCACVLCYVSAPLLLYTIAVHKYTGIAHTLLQAAVYQ
jgi:hypothetical protein